MVISIRKISRSGFERNIDRIFEIYSDAFTTGVYEQYLDLEKEKDFCRNLFDLGGFGFLVYEGKKLVGFLLTAPSTYDFRMPDSMKKRYDLRRCLSIAELAVDKEYRRQGIAKKMVNRLLKVVDRSRYDFLFVRTAAHNLPAIHMYADFGFRKEVKIKAEKIKKDRSRTFIEIKQYLIKELKD
jgi:ribosomal protein S18 acetylase RimI-like enzyme